MSENHIIRVNRTRLRNRENEGLQGGEVIKSEHSITHSLHSLHLMSVWHSFASCAAYLYATLLYPRQTCYLLLRT